MMDFDKMFSALADKPWLIAVAAIVGYLLFRPSQPVASGGVDYSATLASQKIASETNVALSGIGAQVAQVNAARDIAAGEQYVQLAAGAQALTMFDKQAGLTRNLTFMQTMQANQTAGMDLLGGLAAMTYGHKEAMTGFANELELGRAALDNERFATQSQADVARLNTSSSANVSSKALDIDLSKFNINSMLQQALAGIDLEALALELPYDERMHMQEQATIRDLAWRQKQIAKYSAKMNVFNNLIGAGASLGGAALGRL